jgi:hypothetical protein
MLKLYRVFFRGLSGHSLSACFDCRHDQYASTLPNSSDLLPSHSPYSSRTAVANRVNSGGKPRLPNLTHQNKQPPVDQ